MRHQVSRFHFLNRFERFNTLINISIWRNARRSFYREPTIPVVLHRPKQVSLFLLLSAIFISCDGFVILSVVIGLTVHQHGTVFPGFLGLMFGVTLFPFVLFLRLWGCVGYIWQLVLLRCHIVSTLHVLRPRPDSWDRGVIRQ